MPQFGTSGLRGRADELTDSLVANYATAFLARAATGQRQVLIGQDLRASSPRIAAAVIAGAARAGVQAQDCGVLPTPALALAATSRGLPAIMVTGSHIPADRNGIKFYTAEGEITKDDEGWLIADAEALPDIAPAAATAEDLPDARAAFIARYATAFGPGALKGLRIGVYRHSSVARDVMEEIITALGGTPVPLGHSDTFVAVDTEAVDESTRKRLSDWAKAEGLDAIISTDGDADRPMLTDATGRVVPGDRIGPVTARAVGATHVVTPVSSNTLVDRMQAFEVKRCRIGSPYVIAGMEVLARERVVGYEPNGGFLLGFEAEMKSGRLPPLMTRDFALPILAPLATARAEGVGVAELFDALPARFTATDRLQDVPTQISATLVANLLAGDHSVLPEGVGAVADIDTTDGARMTLEDGTILHIRPSGNAPELRCYVEAGDRDAAWSLLAQALAKLRQAVDARG